MQNHGVALAAVAFSLFCATSVWQPALANGFFQSLNQRSLSTPKQNLAIPLARKPIPGYISTVVPSTRSFAEQQELEAYAKQFSKRFDVGDPHQFDKVPFRISCFFTPLIEKNSWVTCRSRS